MFKKIFYLIILGITSNTFCMKPNKELGEKMANIINGYKFFLSVKENRNPRYEYLTKIVDTQKNLSFYEQTVLQNMKDEDFKDINKSIMGTATLFLFSKQTPDLRLEQDLCLLIDFLANFGKLDSTLRLSDGSNLLILAVCMKLTQFVSLLLNKKIFNVNEKNQHGMTPLMYASGCECERHLVILQQLIDAGANIDEKDNLGQTSLMHTCCKGNKKTAEILISSGANIYLEDNEGNNAYDLARKKRQIDMVVLLTSEMISNKK